MTERTASRKGWRWLALVAVLVLATVAGLIYSPRTVEAGGTGPDVTVIYLGSTRNYGESGGVRGYAVGTTSCNTGSEPIWWCDNTRPYCDDAQHPVIAQNLYRLKDGRFEQIGMSWLKHGFLSTNSFDSACGSCQGPPNGGDQLGVGCTDTYGSSLNGSRPLGMRSEVNATNGFFPFPETQVGTSAVYDQRIRVAESELSSALNPGARYWVEGHYITEDDALADNGLNNASYREVTVDNDFDLNLQGSTIREQPAIAVWQVVDPSVEMQNVDFSTAPVQRFHAARKVTSLGNGIWHYEYAIHNMNSDRSAHSFQIQLPPGTAITGAGFHDVDHHSGEPYDDTDWMIDVDSPAGTVTWSTDDFATDQNANALRWGTMFSFWFDAEVQPDGHTHSLGLFKPGSPSSVDFVFGAVDPSIFADGFESGNSLAWSLTTP